MGILAASYDIGNIVALVLSAAIMEMGAGWRALFVVNPAIVLVVAMVAAFALPSEAREEQARAADDARAEVVDAADDARAEVMDPKVPETLRALVVRLATEPSFWFAAALSFLLTFVRAGFMTWTPRFLYEVSVAAGVASPIASSIAKSALFGVAGVVGSVITGRVSDRLGPGRRAPAVTTSLAMLVVCTLALGHAGVTSPHVATVGVALCGLFLLGPYSLLSGAVSLDVAGARGAATAASVIDAVGYVGASGAAFILGSVSRRAGWTAAFDVVAGVTFAALLVAAGWSLRRAPRTA